MKEKVTFSSPPVTEAVLGVEFRVKQDMGPINLVEFARSLENEFPQLQEMPPLPPTLEGNGEPIFSFSSSAEVPFRIWCISNDGEHLVQLQNDRLVLNWRKTGAKSEYPGFDTLRNTFENLWGKFHDFLSSQRMESTVPRYIEYTYVNGLNEGNNTQLASVLAIANKIPKTLPGEQTSIQLVVARKLVYEGQVGFINIQAGEQGDSNEWGLTISTKLRIDANEKVMEVLDDAHNFSLETFKGITTLTAQKDWGSNER